jgi:ketosteroid isomerase-like protein
MLLGCASAAVGLAQSGRSTQTQKDQVVAAERGFAGAMAKRDHNAFTTFLSSEATFISDAAATQVLRGKAAVAKGWRGLFNDEKAPFSWEPEVVEVLESGSLALSTGPVKNPEGEIISRFTSIWRKESDGQWRVIFDRGCAQCRCAP